MKILYILDSLVAGGVERQTTALITGLNHSRYQPEVLCFYASKIGASLHFKPQLEAANVPVQVLDLAYSPQDKFRAFLAIIRAAWHYRPDMIHTVNYHGNSLIGYTRRFLPPGTRLIVSVRAENTAKQIRNQAVSWRVCDHIICNSLHLKTELVDKAGLPAEKITHIPNGLDLARFSSMNDPTFRQQIASESDFVILMVVRISARKVPEMLAEAIGILKAQDRLPANIKAIIVGEREDEATQARLEAAIQQHDLMDIVKQYPQQDNISKFYHAADVSVLVSLWGEGLPNVILESLAAGRPVIASEAANRANIIEHGKTGWIVRTDDVEHLAETLAMVMNLPKEQLEMMRHACQQTASRYTMQNMIDQHQTIYHNIRGK